MRTVSMHEAKTHLSRLIEEAAEGQPFVITKEGRPMVKIVPIEQALKVQSRVGFMAGQFSVPDDFDRMGSERIERLFGSDV